MKKAIEYLRFSSDKQSNYSIERQELITQSWMKTQGILLIDSFKDDGYSARNFDRPDVKNLFAFIAKHYREIDYLVVAELSRFSREAGDAITMVKKIQNEFGVQIVSASRGSIYDIHDSNSFFMMGLEFLLSNSENIKRTADIKGGIYTAKSSGKFISPHCPYGYIKEKKGNSFELTIDEEKASIVRFIFNSYLQNVPIVSIAEAIKEMGFKLHSKSIIQDILNNPKYAGYQFVEAWRDKPGGLMKGNWPPIIELAVFNQVQEKYNKPAKLKLSIDDSFPLRGVLKCHCNRPLTGAPSKSRNGSYYNYYKCSTTSKHNNINATKAHAQLDEALKYLSIPERLIAAIKSTSEQMLDNRMKDVKKQLTVKRKALEETATKLKSVEEKFILNQLSFESYQTWHNTLLQERNLLAAQVQQLGRDDNQIYLLLNENLQQLSDLNFIYHKMKTTEKQQMLRMVFDNQLYYKEGVYRTNYIMPAFTSNTLILKQKQLLILEEKSGIVSQSRLSGD